MKKQMDLSSRVSVMCNSLHLSECKKIVKYSIQIVKGRFTLIILVD